MIPHTYTPIVRAAQLAADGCGRQEVTIDWYLEHMFDYPLFRWIEGQDEFGLDPWRYYMDFPVDSEEAKARGWRIFVQRKDFVKLHNETGRFTYCIGRVKTNGWQGGIWGNFNVFQNDESIFSTKDFALAEQVVREREADQDYFFKMLNDAKNALAETDFDEIMVLRGAVSP